MQASAPTPFLPALRPAVQKGRIKNAANDASAAKLFQP